MTESPTRILVVEDEGVVAKDLQMRLRKLGYDVPTTVQTGEEAIVAAKEFHPELILMDIRLKGAMDGVETSARIMEEFRTPVIFLTAYADDGTLGRAKLTEPYGFILKPFNERELHTAIQVALHRHKGEAALRKSERWLSGTLRSIADAIVAVDFELRVLFMNDVAAKLTGWNSVEAIGCPLADVYHLTDAGSFEPIEITPGDFSTARSSVTADTSILSREAILVSRLGTRTPIEDNTAPIVDDAGRAGGGVLVFRDISKRKEAESAHRANEEQLQTLANSISHLAWMAGPDGSIFWFNDRWYQYTGTTAEDMVDWGWKSVHDPEILPEVLRRWKESLATGTPFDMELPLRSVSDQYRWFLTRVTPVTNVHGEVVRWFGTHTDVHEAREIREQLQRANANLAQFAYSASHDLREPLRNVTVFSQLLAKRCAPSLDAQGTEFLGYITDGAIRMEALVNDLLAYAESGNPLSAPLDVADSKAVLEDVIAGLKTVIIESGAEVTFSDLPTLTTRKVHLRQLFQNLLSNAIKYRSSAPPRIHVSAAGKGAEWVFAVKDNGIGISSEYQDKIFGLFKRLHNADEYSGTGLGLALCTNIVGLYSGRIWVESTPGEGAVFYFSLPQ